MDLRAPRSILMFVLLAFGICRGDFARAYVLQGGKWPQPGSCATPSNCLGAPVTLTYSYQNMFDGGLKMPDGQPLRSGLIRRSIEDALRLWANVAPLHFVEVSDNGLAYGVAGAQFGQIRFMHKYINGPDPPPPADPIAKAQAYFPYNFGDIAGDVQYDNGDRWQKNGTLPVPDILGATIHELGHALGLGHDLSKPETNMYWIFTRYQGPGTGKLHPDDIAGIRAIYGAGQGSVTPHMPEPSAGALAILSLLFAAAIRRVR